MLYVYAFRAKAKRQLSRPTRISKPLKQRHGEMHCTRAIKLASVYFKLFTFLAKNISPFKARKKYCSYWRDVQLDTHVYL